MTADARVKGDGWRLVAMHDPDCRRGLWMRPRTDGGVELCAGREGDDVFAALVPGAVVDEALVQRVTEALARTAVYVDEAALMGAYHAELAEETDP